LPLALTSRATVHTLGGELAAAASLNEEAKEVIDATGSQLAPYGALALAAWQGRDARVQALIDAITKEVGSRGEGIGLTVVQWARALVCNSRGRYEEAQAAAEDASREPRELSVSARALVELIEAASRTGNAALARDELERLSVSTGASGTDWALGIEARCRALLSDDEATEDLYLEAIERLGRTRIRGEYARSHLVYGEWLRRRRRRLDAREHLRTAYDLLTGMGLEAFAERARRELRATGESARKRTPETGGGTDPSGGPDRSAGPRRAHQPGNRSPAVHQSPDGRVPPPQSLRQARRRLSRQAPQPYTYSTRGSSAAGSAALALVRSRPTLSLCAKRSCLVSRSRPFIGAPDQREARSLASEFASNL
jgi:tetratricopeptide (TPR) repeat protein